jgi:hypothetical protein
MMLWARPREAGGWRLEAGGLMMREETMDNTPVPVSATFAFLHEAARVARNL